MAKTTEEKMYCYLWHELSDEKECKFGERWIKVGQDPETEIWKRIKDSVGVRKDKISDGTIKLEEYWDVSELAKEVGRFKMHGRIDDYIREHIGHRKGTTGEVHKLDASVMALKVNEYLKKTNQPLITAGLSQWQYDQAEEVIRSIDAGKKTILAELCARFGKTIWSGALTVETKIPLTIVASYVLTSFASFAKDLTKFQQFRNLVVIDSAEQDYQQKIEDAFKQGKQVVVFLSMVGSKKRQDRINYLFNLCPQDFYRYEIENERLVFIDEADYGAHTTNQADPFIDARKENDIVILMTGTNGERAVGNWVIDHYLGTTYAELLMEKAGV